MEPINSLFPNLIDSHKEILEKYLNKIVDLIIIKFGMSDKSVAFKEMLMENNMDSYKGLVLLLLPYVDNMINADEIQSFDDIYIKKETDVDINATEPRYKFSNLQYNRCKRDYGKATEIPFNEDHLKHNYYLLRETIQIVANKLYVNWINIRPRSLKDNTDSKLYEATMEAIDQNKVPLFDPMDDEEKDEYSGIYIGDIYDVLSNKLFHSVVDIKWLIYDVREGEKIIPMYYLIDKFFNLKNIIDNKFWNQQNTNSRQLFTETWKKLNNAIESEDSYKNISHPSIRILLRAIVAFFDKKNSNNKKIIDSGYIPLEGISRDVLEDEGITRNEKYDDKIFKTMPTITAENMYEFLRTSFDKFKTTWYSKKINHRYDNLNENYDKDGLLVTSKIFYNFAKSLTHYKGPDNTYLQTSRYWRSLNKNDRKEFHKRLSWDVIEDGDVSDFFNIDRYIKYLYENENIRETNGMLFYHVKKEFANDIYNIMIRNGILSEFVLDKELTDKSFRRNKDYLDKKLNELVFTKDKDKWEKSFYFLTGKKFTDHMVKIKDKTSNRMVEKSYLNAETMGAKSKWYDFITMNWVTQIGFFHRYLNNRIIYVTGGTGAGKTSQMPKLLLYALKMIDYNDDGSIMMSQPRRALVSSNTESISYQMGVPIREYQGDLQDNVISDNYYLQYKHGDGGHTRKQNGLTLQLVTDRILYDALRENSLLLDYSGNKYDIVVIDESHEHNENMDLILTLMRNATYYNNSLKMVIISATMEMDEPVYRRYYRDINDNRMYPFNHMLKENNLDRINVDRRLHLASPNDLSSGGVRYKIDEFPQPNKEANEIIMEIATKTADGDILVFQPGKKEIIASRDYLNANLPSNFIALPLFSELPKKKLDFITNNFDVKKYTLPRDVPYESRYDEVNVKRVQPGTYTRAVIISTNLAEASLTISSLKYVVDTGTEKSMIYNYNIRSSGINLSQISESSRKQRKGRVGRVSPGSVYYTYDIEETKDIKQKFSISIGDMNELLYGLLREKCNEISLFNDSNDPNRTSSLSASNLYSVYPDEKKEGKIIVSNKLIRRMIKDQYFYKGNFIDYKGNTNHYDYGNRKAPPTRYLTGYSRDTLTDKDGAFYIVHPEEVNFRRNILGQIKETIGDDVILNNGNIESPKINSFWNILEERLMIFDDVSCRPKDISKTEYGNKLLFFKGRLKTWEIGYILSFLYSRKYGVGEEMKLLIPMYRLLNGQMSRLAYVTIENGQEVNSFDKLVHAYGTCFGDSCSLISAINAIFDGLSVMSIDLKLMIDSLRNRLKLGKNYKVTDDSNIMTMKQNYLNKQYNDIDIDTFNKFKKLDSTNRLSSDNQLSDAERKELVKEDAMLLNPNIVLETNADKISYWCKRNYFNPEVITSYIKGLVSFLNEVYKYENKIYDIDNDLSDHGVDLPWFDQKLTNVKLDENNDKCENITRAFLTAFPSNIVKRIEGSQLFIPILNPAPQNTFGIGGVSGFPVIKNALLKQNCYPDYLLHLFSNYEKNTISYVHKVTPETIQAMVPFLYLPSKFKYGYYDENAQKEAIEHLTLQLTKNLEPKDKKRKITYGLVSDYVKTIKKIKKDMVQSYTPTIYENLQSLSDDPNFEKSMSELTKREEDERRNIQYGGNGYHIDNHKSLPKGNPRQYYRYTKYMIEKLNYI